MFFFSNFKVWFEIYKKFSFITTRKSFKLKTLDGNEIGVLKKMYAGFVNEYATTADRFGINCKLLYIERRRRRDFWIFLF